MYELKYFVYKNITHKEDGTGPLLAKTLIARSDDEAREEVKRFVRDSARLPHRLVKIISL